MTTKDNGHRLIFSMDLADSNSLVWGNLKLIYPDGTDVDYLATSGCPGYQDKKDQWTRARGPIPPGFEYFIPTTPYYVPTKGVEGMFFHIKPDPVVSPQGVTRGEFGIHFDANVPGSSGCIVLKNKSGFNAFCERMKQLAGSGLQSVSLQVSYS